MDNKNCYSLIDWYLIVGGDHYRGAHERRERRRAPRWRGSGRHVLGGCLQSLYMLQACVAAPEGGTPLLSALGLRWPLLLWLPASLRRRLPAARLCPVVLRQGSSQPAALDRM